MKSRLKCIAVSSAGGDIGFNVCRILKDIDLSEKLIAFDIKKNHATCGLISDCIQLPSVNEKNYFEILESYVRKFEVEILIPLSEPEIEFFNKKGISSIGNARILLASENAIRIGLDKLLTNQFLVENKLPAPWTKCARLNRPKSYPCIMKARRGCGSKAVHILTEFSAVKKITDKLDNYIFQELLLPDDQEYTCGLFRSKKEEVRSIIFKRVLHGGMTGEGEVVNNKKIKNLLEDIATKINLVGSINIQLRLTKNGPMVFEINPRFSSTVQFRHKLGFKDLIWSIQDIFEEDIDDFIPPKQGTKFYKVPDEIILNPETEDSKDNHG